MGTQHHTGQHTLRPPDTTHPETIRQHLDELNLPQLPHANQQLDVIRSRNHRLHTTTDCPELLTAGTHTPTTTLTLQQAAPLLCKSCLRKNNHQQPTPTADRTATYRSTYLHADLAQQWLELRTNIDELHTTLNTDDNSSSTSDGNLHQHVARLSTLTTTTADNLTAPRRNTPSGRTEAHHAHTLQQQFQDAHRTIAIPKLEQLRQTLHQRRDPQRHLQSLAVANMLTGSRNMQTLQDRTKRQADLQLLTQICPDTKLQQLSDVLTACFHHTLQTTDNLDIHTDTAVRNYHELRQGSTTTFDDHPTHHIKTTLRTLLQRWQQRTRQTIADTNQMAPRLLLIGMPADQLTILLQHPIRHLIKQQLVAVVHPLEAARGHTQGAIDCGPIPAELQQLDNTELQDVLQTAAATYKPDSHVPHQVVLPRHVQAIVASLT